MSAPPLNEKAFATLQAKAALQGVTLVRIVGEQGRDVFIASKWAMSRQFENIEQIDQLLERMSGA